MKSDNVLSESDHERSFLAEMAKRWEESAEKSSFKIPKHNLTTNINGFQSSNYKLLKSWDKNSFG